MNFSGLDNSSFQLMVEKFNGKNYREWTQSVKLVVNGKGKMEYLIGETIKPASTNASAVQQWSSENSMVMAWLVNSMLSAIEKT